MFDWLKRKKSPDFKSVAHGLLAAQLVPHYESPHSCFGALMTNDKAAGYVFGLHDCLIQRMGLYNPEDRSKAGRLIEDSYKNLFGQQAGYLLFSKSLQQQENAEFQSGRMEGGNEVDDYLSSKTPALGLQRMLILDDHPQPSEVEENPVSEFERKIRDWPEDQARAALRVVKSVLEGTQDYEEDFNDLTISQVRAVTELLEKIEGKA